MKREEKILEVLIKEELDMILKEEFNDPLAQTFIQPFTDIIKTAKAGIEKTTAVTAGEITKLASRVAAVLLPFIEFDQIEAMIQQNLDQKLDKIGGKYEDVLQRNYDMMRSRDLWGLGFLFNPALAIGVSSAQKAPEFALQTLDAFTGGNPFVEKMLSKVQSINKKVLGGGSGVEQGSGFVGMGGGDFGGMGMGFGESVMYEQEQEQQQPQYDVEKINKVLGKQIAQAAQNPKIKNAMMNSPLAKKMREMGKDIVLNTVKELVAIEDYNDLQKVFGDMGIVEKKINEALPEDATPEQVEEMKQSLVPEVKKYIKEMYIKQLEQISKQLDNPKEMQDVIEKIQAL